MSVGHMLMRLRLGVLLGLLAGPVSGQTAATCEMLVGALRDLSGLDLSAPPAPDVEGWCVLDGARLAGEGAPRITVQRLRIKGEATDGVLIALDVDSAGLRVTPALADRDIESWLRDLMRLQTADLRLSVRRDEAADVLIIQDGILALSGGTEVTLSARIAAATLAASSVLSGRVTELDLTWKNDGRTLRPAMEALGEGLVDGASGSTAVDATRAFLRQHADNLPDALFQGNARDELEQLIAALPQGRGRLALGFVSEAGIGAAKLAIASLSDVPLSPAALSRLFEGASVSLDWQAGIAP
jgi:hypothetical protein